MHRPFFSTGEIAQLCGVAPRTVCKWIDTGQLKGFRIPGSNDRRVSQASLDSFMRSIGMKEVSVDHSKAIVLGVVPHTLEEIEGLSHIRFHHMDLFQAALEIKERCPSLIIYDERCGIPAFTSLMRFLEQSPARGSTSVIVLSSKRSVWKGASAVVRKPTTPSSIAAAICSCLPRPTE